MVPGRSVPERSSEATTNSGIGCDGSTAGRALRAVLRWPDLRLGERLLMLGWMAGVLLLPRALAGRLARQHRRLSGRETPTC